MYPDFSLPDLCDAHPELVQVVEPMFVNYGGRDAFCGEIATVKCHEDNSLVADRLEEPGRGRVLVVDGGGSMRCGLLGDNLARKAQTHGWSGVIVYGCIRDVDPIGTMDIGVAALGCHPLKSVKRNVGLLDVPVTFGGVTFRPGSWVYADNNGVLVTPGPLSVDAG